jgi:hypothetical protein
MIFVLMLQANRTDLSRCSVRQGIENDLVERNGKYGAIAPNHLGLAARQQHASQIEAMTAE